MKITRSAFRLHRSAFSTLLCALVFEFQGFANTIIYQPLTPPKFEDIVAFANEPSPGSGKRLLKSREEILKFLKEGTPVLNLNDWDKVENAAPDFEDICTGVFTDKEGNVYFWNLRNAFALKITTQDNKTALLKISK